MWTVGAVRNYLDLKVVAHYVLETVLEFKNGLFKKINSPSQLSDKDTISAPTLSTESIQILLIFLFLFT